MPFGGNVLNTSQVQTLIDASKGAIQTVSPTTGQTVVMTDDNSTGALIITPAGTLATLTITLPSDVNSVVNQERTIFCTKVVTSLTINGASTIYGIVTALSVGDCITFRKVATNMWAKKI